MRRVDRPVRLLQPGDMLELPVSKRRVTVERVDHYNEQCVVRWWRHADRGEPGWGPEREGMDGRYLGSFLPLHPDTPIPVIVRG